MSEYKLKQRNDFDRRYIRENGLKHVNKLDNIDFDMESKWKSYFNDCFTRRRQNIFLPQDKYGNSEN